MKNISKIRIMTFMIFFYPGTLLAQPPNTLWTRMYGGYGPQTSDEGYAIQETADGGYIIAGRTNLFGPSMQNFYLLKLDYSGDTLWTRTYGINNADVCWSVQQTYHGGYIMSGSSTGDMYLVKL